MWGVEVVENFGEKIKPKETSGTNLDSNKTFLSNYSNKSKFCLYNRDGFIFDYFSIIGTEFEKFNKEKIKNLNKNLVVVECLQMFFPKLCPIKNFVRPLSKRKNFKFQILYKKNSWKNSTVKSLRKFKVGTGSIKIRKKFNYDIWLFVCCIFSRSLIYRVQISFEYSQFKIQVFRYLKYGSYVYLNYLFICSLEYHPKNLVAFIC